MMTANEPIKLALLDSWKETLNGEFGVRRDENQSGFSCGLTYGVNRRYRSGAVVGDEESVGLVGKVTRRGSVRVERWVRQGR